MSDIRFNNWLHQSGTGGVYQTSTGNIGIGTTVPRTSLDVVGVVSATTFSGNFDGNVGIGENDPEVLLHLKENNADPYNTVVTHLKLDNGGGNQGSGSRIELKTGAARCWIQSYINGPNSNSGGALVFGTPSSAALGTERLRITSTGNVGIGTDNPSKQITVGAAITTSEFQVSPHSAGWDTAVTSGNIHHHYIDNFRVYSGLIGSGTERFKIDNGGRVTIPAQPAFYAYRNSDSNQVSAGDQIFDATRTNRGGHYTTSNGRFTAPVGGAYFFSAALQLYGGPTTGTMMSFRINGTDFHGSQNSSNPVYDELAGAHGMLYFSAVIDLAANEYVTTWSNNTVRGMQSYFTGYLIG